MFIPKGKKKTYKAQELLLMKEKLELMHSNAPPGLFVTQHCHYVGVCLG